MTGGKATELIANGAREEDIIHIAEKRGNLKKTHGIVRDDAIEQTRWLEEGDDASGWVHILERHEEHFIDAFEVSGEGEIETLIYKSIVTIQPVQISPKAFSIFT